MAAAPSGKENEGTGDWESGGGKEGLHIAAIPALRIASRPGQPRLPHMPVKLILRLPTSGEGRLRQAGLWQQQEAGAARAAVEVAGEGASVA